MAESKIDPFDVAALEKSLNDSATRVSTIWVSFLIFSLYLLTAATTVTHRQLFLAEPVKLPVLNIDLPLWGFFFLTPILFVIFHAYVLIQVILLARTAAAYNDALGRNPLPASADASLRQRLANTLFAQIFAGSPHERAGVIGAALKLIAWITLTIGPIFVLLVFQFTFLPYHSHITTWTHRWLILIELLTVVIFWLLVVDSKRGLEWKKIFPNAIALSSISLFVLFVSWILATFPGEWHAGWTRYVAAEPSPDDARGRAKRPGEWRPKAWTRTRTTEKFPPDERAPELGAPYECRTRSLLAHFSPNFDRLFLPWEDVVDDDKLTKLENATRARAVEAYQGERTRNFKERDFRCGVFDGADLRRVDLTDAILVGVNFIETELEGASLEGAVLHRAILNAAKLQGANLAKAQLQGADMIEVQLQGANLTDAQLMGATLGRAQLQTSTMIGADMRGAKLIQARLEGADLTDAKLDAARFYKANLQAARLGGSTMDLTHISFTRLWRSTGDVEGYLGYVFCDAAQIIHSGSDLRLLHSDGSDHPGLDAKPEDIERFLELSVNGVPAAAKDAARAKLRRWIETGSGPSSGERWQACASKALPEKEFAEKWRRYLVHLACERVLGQENVVAGILRNFENPNYEDFWGDEDGLSIGEAQLYFARALLGLDSINSPCASRSSLDRDTVQRLRRIVTRFRS